MAKFQPINHLQILEKSNLHLQSFKEAFPQDIIKQTDFYFYLNPLILVITNINIYSSQLNFLQNSPPMPLQLLFDMTFSNMLLPLHLTPYTQISASFQPLHYNPIQEFYCLSFQSLYKINTLLSAKFRNWQKNAKP